MTPAEIDAAKKFILKAGEPNGVIATATFEGEQKGPTGIHSLQALQAAGAELKADGLAHVIISPNGVSVRLEAKGLRAALAR